MKKNSKNIGLLGSITHDVITLPSGKIFKGLGGILYPASVLCGLDKNVTLMTHLAEELVPSVLSVLKGWSTINFNGVKRVPGPGNRVKLYYSEQEERQEIMESVGPPLEAEKILNKLPDINFLVLLMISGMDITLRDWNKVKEKAACPLWMDIHSLALSPEVGEFRKYSPITNWRDWVRGVDYVQANRKEAASMMGCHDKNPSEEEFSIFGESVLKQGVRAFFITLGKDGLLVVTPQGAKKMKPEGSNKVVDTTGCGDVFCGAAVSQLLEGKDIMDAVGFGLELATRAVERSGIRETFEMTQEFKRGSHEE
ncbi:MAG: PfkB family carbohydrate kinase [Candidatus Aminicenantes bacterium]